MFRKAGAADGNVSLYIKDVRKTFLSKAAPCGKAEQQCSGGGKRVGPSRTAETLPPGNVYGLEKKTKESRLWK